MSLTTSQYDSIMQMYDRRQRERYRLIEQRKKEIYETVPEYRTIDNQIASESINACISSLSGNSDTVNLQAVIDNLKSKKEKLLIDSGYPSDYLDPEYTCPDCKDTGYIGNDLCHCFRQAMLDSTYLQTTAKMLKKEETFENISHEYHTGEELTNFINAENASRNFVNNFNQNHGNILFTGTPGSGKTYLSNCIANELIKNGYSVIYFSSVSLFERISSYTFSKNKNDKDNPLEDIYSCDLLIIDDLGSEFTNQFVCSELFSIINERYLSKKSTIISTNLDLTALCQRYTDRTFSRLYSYYDVFDLTGNDIRVYLKRIENRK